MSQFHERLAEAIAARGYKSESEFARAVGLSPQSVHQWIKGETQPGKKNLPRVVALLRVNLEWLMNGLGPRDSIGLSGGLATGDTMNNGATIVAFDTISLPRIPIVELEDLYVSKGRLQYRVPAINRNPIVSMFPTGPQAVAFTMQDRSMEPKIDKGDIVTIDPDIEPQPGDCIAFRLIEKDKNILRTYSMGVNGEIVCSPTNALYETLRFSSEDWKREVEVLGVMAWFAKPRRT